MVEETLKKWGRIDILINNAGALWWKDMLETPMNRYDLINGVNARGTFLCTKLCLPHMLAQGWGHIVNMSPPIDLGMLKGIFLLGLLSGLSPPFAHTPSHARSHWILHF